MGRSRMSIFEMIWHHGPSRVYFTLLPTVACLYLIIKIFRNPEKLSILYKIKHLWTNLGSDKQFMIIFVFAVMSFVTFLIMFTYPNLLGKSFLAIPIIYMVLVIAYALTKEIKRHQDKTLLKLPGELFVLGWTIFVVTLDIINFFNNSTVVPPLLENTYYLVLTVFFITRTSKIHKLAKSPKGAPYKNNEVGFIDKITFNAQYYIGLFLGVSCLSKYVLDFISQGRFTATAFGVSIYIWYITTYAGEKEFRRLSNVKSKRPIGTKHGQWMVAVWVIMLILMYSVSLMTKLVYEVPKSLLWTIFWIILIYFFTIIAKFAIKNGKK